MKKVLPQSPPPQMALFEGKFKDLFVPDDGSQHLANFLKSCTAEMVMALQAMGKINVNQLAKEDLVKAGEEDYG